MNHKQMLIDRRVLVVNDSPQITALLADSLAASGARVTEAHCGRDGMQYIAWGGYDLIVVHLATPAAAEQRILSFIEESRPELLTRTIVLTGRALDGKAQNRLRICHSTCLVMPSVPANLEIYALRALAVSEQRCAA
jgi:CheY-like chemotaxis protein